MGATENAYNNWRQFSAGMGKLAPVGGTAPKFVPEATQSVSKMDWAGQVFDVVGKAAKVFDVVKQESFSKAEEFMKTHSLEEYRQAVNDNNIPFQNDPIAMARLKNLHGGVAANMAYQDFMNRVSNNEFRDMTPEQVDSEYFKHMNKSFDDLKDTFGYANGSDQAYNTGFWENGDKSRKSVMDAQVVVKNDWNRKQSTILETSRLNMLASDPTANGEVLWEAFNSAYMGGAFHANPTESARVGEAMFKNLSNNPDGSRLIDELKDKQIPGQKDGVTFGSLFGDDGLRMLKAKANGARDEADFNNYMQFAQTMNGLVNANDGEGDLTGLQTMIDSELSVSGGAESPRLKELNRAVIQVHNNRVGLAKAAEKEQQKEQEGFAKVRTALGVYDSLLNGGNPLSMKLAGTDREAMQRAWEFTKQTIKPQDYLRLASANYEGNIAREEFQNKLGSTVTRINGDIQNSKGEVLLPSEIPQPKELEELVTLYNTNPSDFMASSGGMRDGDFNSLLGVYNAMASGTPYNEVVAGMAKFQQLDTKQKRALEDSLVKISLNDSGAKSRGITGDYAKATVFAWAGYGIRAGMPEKDAYQKAVERFNETHINVAGTAIPSSFLSYNNLKLPPDVAGDAIDNVLKDVLSRTGLSEEVVSVRFDPGRQQLHIQNNSTGMFLGTITQENLKPVYDKMVAEAEASKVAAEEYVKKKNESMRAANRMAEKNPFLKPLR